MKKNKYKFLSQVTVVLSLLLESYFCSSTKSIRNDSEEADVISVDLNNDFNDREVTNSDDEDNNTSPINTWSDHESKTLRELYDATLPFLYVELNLNEVEQILKDCRDLFSSQSSYKNFHKDRQTVIKILNKIKEPAKRFSMLLSAYNRNVLAASFLKIYFEYDKNLINKISFNMKEYLGEDFIENIEKTEIAERVSKGNLSYSNILNRLAYSTLVFTFVINDSPLFPKFAPIKKESINNLYSIKKIQQLLLSKDPISTNFKTLFLEAKHSYKLLWVLGYVDDNRYIIDEDFIKSFDYYESRTSRLLGISRLLTMLSTISHEKVYSEIMPQNEYKTYCPLYEKQDEKLKILCNMVIEFQKSFPRYRDEYINDIVDSEYLKEGLTNIIYIFAQTLSLDMLEAPKEDSRGIEKTLEISPKKDFISQIMASPVRADKVTAKSRKVDVADLSFRTLMVDTLDDDMAGAGDKITLSKYDEVYKHLSTFTCGDLCTFIIDYLNKKYGETLIGQAFLRYNAYTKPFYEDLSKPSSTSKGINFEKVEGFQSEKLNLTSKELLSVFDLAYDNSLSNEEKENLLLILLAKTSGPSDKEEEVLKSFFKYDLSQLKVSLFPPLSLDFSDESIKIIELGKKKLFPSDDDLRLAAGYNKEQHLDYTSIDQESRNKLLINLNILTKENKSAYEKESAAKAVFAVLSQNSLKLLNQTNNDFTSFDIHMMLIEAARIKSIPFAIEAWLVTRFNFLSEDHKNLLNSLSSLSLLNESDTDSRAQHKQIVVDILKKEFPLLPQQNPQFTSFDVFNRLSDLIKIHSPTFAVEAWLAMAEFYNAQNKLPESDSPKKIEDSSIPLLTNDSFNK